MRFFVYPLYLSLPSMLGYVNFPCVIRFSPIMNSPCIIRLSTIAPRIIIPNIYEIPLRHPLFSSVLRIREFEFPINFPLFSYVLHLLLHYVTYF